MKNPKSFGFETTLTAFSTFTHSHSQKKKKNSRGFESILKGLAQSIDLALAWCGMGATREKAALGEVDSPLERSWGGRGLHR